MKVKTDKTTSAPVFDVGSVYKLTQNSTHIIRASSIFNSISRKDEVYVIGGDNSTGQDPTVFVSSFLRKIMYFSYRNLFQRLPSGGTTDAGWGCLLRSAQMLMSTALLRAASDGKIPLFNDWHSTENTMYGKIESLFMDEPNATFGIHRLHEESCKAGACSNSFLSPTHVAEALVGANNNYNNQCCMSHLHCLRTSCVEKKTVFNLIGEGPVLLLIPVVCGYKTVANNYQNALFEFIRFPCCNGLLIGHKNAGYFAFGHQKRTFLCLDPHYIQKAYSTPSTRGKRKGKCFTCSANDIEPSLLISFYIHDSQDMESLCTFLSGINSKLPLPLIPVIDDEFTLGLATNN